MQALLQDLRYAMRTLAQRPAFTMTVVFTLALGIGTNTAIFTLIDAVMIKILPVKNPEELVMLIGNPDWSGLASQLSPRPPGDQDRSHGGAEMRVGGSCAFRIKGN